LASIWKKQDGLLLYGEGVMVMVTAEPAATGDGKVKAVRVQFCRPFSAGRSPMFPVYPLRRAVLIVNVSAEPPVMTGGLFRL
jgi:hypothetical protein